MKIDSLDNRDEFKLANLTHLEFSRPIMVDVHINDAILPMAVDTGAAVTFICKKFMSQIFQTHLRKFQVVLKTYVAEKLKK